MGISHLTNKRLKNVKQSATSDHLLTCDCSINFYDFTILSKDSDNNLLIKRGLLISCHISILNKTIKSCALELLEYGRILVVVKHLIVFFNKRYGTF